MADIDYALTWNRPGTDQEPTQNRPGTVPETTRNRPGTNSELTQTDLDFVTPCTRLCHTLYPTLSHLVPDYVILCTKYGTHTHIHAHTQ